MMLVNVKLDVSGFRRIIFQGYKLHWFSSFVMARLKQSWQYRHSCFVEGCEKFYYSQIQLCCWYNWLCNINIFPTRMHSSRMRTGRSLTVCYSLLPGGGGVCSRGGAWSGGSPWGGGAWSGGVSALGGWASQHALRQTPSPPVDRHTLVKTLPWPNLVKAGKNIRQSGS